MFTIYIAARDALFSCIGFVQGVFPYYYTTEIDALALTVKTVNSKKKSMQSENMGYFLLVYKTEIFNKS